MQDALLSFVQKRQVCVQLIRYEANTWQRVAVLCQHYVNFE